MSRGPRAQPYCTQEQTAGDLANYIQSSDLQYRIISAEYSVPLGLLEV